MSNTNIFNLPSGEQIDTMNTILMGLLEAQKGSIKPASWSNVQALVRAGLHSKVFSIGDQLSCSRGNETLVWDVIGIDHDTPTDAQFTHSLTLQLHDCFPTAMMFDAPEAFYYAEEGLAAGTYHFTVPSDYDTDYNTYSGAGYQFTLTNAVPAGGQLVLNWARNTQASAATVSSFASGSAVSAIETVSVSEGTGGTGLGELTVAGDAANHLNSIDRARFGSNNYKESAIRQWLCSDAAAGSVWTPQTDFDRPPAWAADTAGFMNGMDADFLAAVGETTVSTMRNPICEDGEFYETHDRFFLPSFKEVYFSFTPNEGTVYPYYADYSDLAAPDGAADANRVKYRNGTAAVWWTRSVISAATATVWRVMDDGRRSSDTVNKSSYYAAPVCNII